MNNAQPKPLEIPAIMSLVNSMEVTNYKKVIEKIRDGSLDRDEITVLLYVANGRKLNAYQLECFKNVIIGCLEREYLSGNYN